MFIGDETVWQYADQLSDGPLIKYLLAPRYEKSHSSSWAIYTWNCSLVIKSDQVSVEEEVVVDEWV